MNKREFITLLSSAAAWPLGARAQQPAMPLIGLIHAGSPATSDAHIASFRQGLNEMGYVEGGNERSNTAGPKNAMIGIRSWLPIWSARR